MMKEVFYKIREKMDDASIGLFGSNYINVEKVNDILDEVLTEHENDVCVWKPYTPYTSGIYEAHGSANITNIIDLKSWTYCKHCGKLVRIEVQDGKNS